MKCLCPTVKPVTSTNASCTVCDGVWDGKNCTKTPIGNHSLTVKL